METVEVKVPLKRRAGRNLALQPADTMTKTTIEAAAATLNAATS